MTSFINEEVWELLSIPIFISPKLKTDKTADEYYRVLRIFNVDSSKNKFYSGMFIPRSQLIVNDEDWLEQNKDKIAEHQWPVVRRSKLDWILDPKPLNRL